MIENPTTLILGAGASMDFGYPSGRDLKDKVVKMIASPNNDAYRSLQKLGFDDYLIKSFQEGLQRSGRPSVDAFLEHRPEFIEVGKAAMAVELMSYENINALFPTGGSWYEHLFQAINASFEDLSSNKLKIITFNYDRSLDIYLFEAIKNAYGKQTEKVSEVLKTIPILHVHGKLGPMPWESDRRGREYRSSYDPVDIKQAADNICIITEDHETKKEFSDAKRLISASKRLIFIGFGYHSQNIERLGIDIHSGQLSIFGSAYGLTQLEKNKITESFKPSVIQLGQRDWKALQFLREMINL
jgi:hypothetical protein